MWLSGRRGGEDGEDGDCEGREGCGEVEWLSCSFDVSFEHGVVVLILSGQSVREESRREPVFAARVKGVMSW